MTARAKRRREEASMLAIAHHDPKSIEEAIPLPTVATPKSKRKWW